MNAFTPKNLLSIPSIRGVTYFGPSKMSFKNLIIHSLSIIGVFKLSVLVRSILFLTVYMFLIHQKITIITIIPVIFVIAMVIGVFVISNRENLYELNNSLENVNNIDSLK